jgi:hypothetical protein
MSDSSSLNIPLHTALTSDMQYGLKPSAPRSRSYRLSVSPLNKSVFVGGDQVIFEIPTSRKGTFLDQSQSYLKFSVQMGATAITPAGGTGIYLDNSAYSFLQRLDIYHSSNLLESTNEYGQLANFLLDTSLTQSDKAGLSTLIGTNNLNTFVSSPAVYAQFGANINVQTAGDRSGQSLKAVATADINTAVPYTFSLPILSGVIGVNASKMLPLGNLSSPIRCEFYLAQNDDAIYSGTAGAGAIWQIVNVEMELCYVEINDPAYEQILPAGEAEYISTTSYRHASTYLPSATSGEFTTLLPFRFSSLTALYGRFRNFSTAVQGANGTACYRKGSSINPNFQSFYYRVGSSIYPNKPIYLNNGSLVGTYNEAYAELLKSFHALSTSIGNSAILAQNYNVASTASQGASAGFVAGSKVAGIQDTHNNAFGIGLELQSFSNRNDTILSGLSTMNSQVFFTGTIISGQVAGGATGYNFTCDFFAQYDMILMIENGIMSAKF